MPRFGMGRLGLAGLALASVAQPAAGAVVLCSSGPGIDLTVDQCTAAGNDHLATVSAAIAAATGSAPVSLALYGKSDNANAGTLFSFAVNPNPHTGQVTNWTVLDGSLIRYVTLKGGTGFKIYELGGAGASSGTAFSTAGLLNNGGNQPEISHLSFWTAAAAVVPEPATWAMLITGFFGIGAAMRRRPAQRGSALA